MNLKKIFLVITFLAVSIGIFGMNSPIIKAITTEELLAEINRLQAQIAQLQKQLAELQGKPAAWCHNFNTNLRIGDSGLEVEALQTALEKEGFNVSGDTKGNFGENTASAVISFQEKYKSEILGPWRLEHGTGYVGQTTRAKLNKLYGCGQIVSPPVTTWQKTYGGPDWDVGHSVSQTSDGGYIIAGGTGSYGAGGSDVYLVKTDANGNLIWQKTFGGIGNDYGYSVTQISDGGYIITGETRSYATSGDVYGDVYLIKTDANGNMIWQKTFGGTNYDCGYSVVQVSDGNYIIAGETGSYGAGEHDVYLIKTDSNGNMVWQKTYGGFSVDIGYSIAQTSDGDYIITGEFNDDDVYLIKTDANGNMIWQKTYGLKTYDRAHGDSGYSVAQTSDGGYIIAGETRLIDGVHIWDVYLIKTDTNGNLIWQKTYGGTGNSIGRSVAQTSDGGYVVAGETSSYGAGGIDVYLIKTDSSGNMIWQKTFGGTDYDWGYSVVQASDGSYIIAGNTRSYGAGRGGDVWLIKIAGE